MIVLAHAIASLRALTGQLALHRFHYEYDHITKDEYDRITKDEYDRIATDEYDYITTDECNNIANVEGDNVKTESLVASVERILCSVRDAVRE